MAGRSIQYGNQGTFRDGNFSHVNVANKLSINNLKVPAVTSSDLANTHNPAKYLEGTLIYNYYDSALYIRVKLDGDPAWGAVSSTPVFPDINGVLRDTHQQIVSSFEKKMTTTRKKVLQEGKKKQVDFQLKMEDDLQDQFDALSSTLRESIKEDVLEELKLNTTTKPIIHHQPPIDYVRIKNEITNDIIKNTSLLPNSSNDVLKLREQLAKIAEAVDELVEWKEESELEVAFEDDDAPLTLLNNLSPVPELSNTTVELGVDAKTLGAHSVAIGSGTNDRGAKTQGIGGVAIGSSIDSNGARAGMGSVALGGARKGAGASALGMDAVALGSRSVSHSSSTLALGTGSKARDGINNISIGNSALTEKTENNIALGTDAISTGGRAVAIGLESRAEGRDALAVCDSAFAKCDNSMAIGPRSRAFAEYSFALGPDASIDVESSHGAIAFGNKTSVSEDSPNSIAFGNGATIDAGARDSIAFGSSAMVSLGACDAIAIGHTADANGLNAIAIGNSGAANTNAVAVGEKAEASGLNALALGTDAVASGASSVALGARAVAGAGVDENGIPPKSQLGLSPDLTTDSPSFLKITDNHLRAIELPKKASLCIQVNIGGIPYYLPLYATGTKL